MLSLVRNSDGEYQLHTATPDSLPLPGADAWGKWADEVEKTGWAYLSVHSNQSSAAKTQAYAAGFFEGQVSAQRIWQSAVNGGVTQPLDHLIVAFINAQQTWLNQQIQANPHSDYWTHISLIESQLAGLTDGYNRASPPIQQLTPLQVRVLSLGAEIGDIAAGVLPEGEVPGGDEDDRFSHCSALLKWLPDRSDVIISQVTWSSFESMLRVFKLYDLPLKTLDGKAVPAVQSSFSSYPGSLYSGDDFYLLSSGLVVQETTIGIYNATVYKVEIKPDTVPEWVRNIVANRLASTGAQWGDIFTRHNSGTYNNQFMILDYKLFTPGQTTLRPGFFVFCEQMPGFTETADLTGLLQRDTYFGAYNVAFFKTIMDKSGGTDMVKKYGPWYSYEHTARAEIFRRDHVKVTNLDGMKRIMRYNDFKNDPLSRCEGCNPPYTGENAIAARCDLNDPHGTYPIASWGFRDHCATDAKITSYALSKKFQVVAQSGPTYDNLPVFVWSTSPFANVSHVGHPDRWNFPWVVVDWNAHLPVVMATLNN